MTNSSSVWEAAGPRATAVSPQAGPSDVQQSLGAAGVQRQSRTGPWKSGKQEIGGNYF